MFVKTTTAVNFTYFKERNKIKFGGDRSVLRSTSAVYLFHVSW